MNTEYKMQSDQGSKSHHCPKCSLVFKSKVFLFEHLNKVHCLNVDAALTSAGLKSADIQKAAADESRCPENNVFKCQLCDFAAFNLDVLTEHKKQNHENLTETVVNHEKEPPDTKIINTSTNQCNNEAEDEPCVETTPILNCTSNSSKDLRMYKRPLQTTTKVSSGSPDLNEHPYSKFTDNSKGTLILQETASTSLNPIWSGVCKVTAMSVIDISRVHTDHHLQEDQLKPKEQNKEVHNQGDKRGKGLLTSDYNCEGPSAKKFKSKNRETVLPESKNANQQPSGGTEFSFEVSDDETEKSSVLVKENPPNPRVFFCKLCDYSDESFKCILSHYQNYHPYVRSNTSFIHDSNDQSATFRCLECPVEFPSSVDLKWHYTEKHPEAPDVFNLQLNELSLAFKCFSCPFTTNGSNALEEHYKEKHPTCEIDHSLLFCQYSVSKCQEESPQVQTCTKVPSPEKSRELSPERVVTPGKDVPSPQQPSPMPAGTLYRCKKCEFTHKSSIVMHVHYKRKHPNKKVTLDEIKQANHKNSLETSQMKPENESSEKADDKQEKPLQMKLSPPESKPRVSEDLSELCAPKPTESVQDETLNKSPNPNRRMTSGLDDSVPSSAEEMYYCMYCDYTNTLLKSVVGHHCSKHLPVSRQDIIEYSADVRKKLMSRNSAKARKGIKKSKKVKSQYEEEEDVDASGQKSDEYGDAETLFYCQRCNLGNPTLQGVLNHQNQVHETLTVKAEIIMKHTASIRSNIKRSKSRGKSKSPTYLPLPIVNKGDENKFFCNLCNFRQAKLVQVLQHYSKTHQGSANKSAVVQQYTNRVLKWLQKSLSKAAANHEMLQKTENGKNKANNSIKSSSSVPPAAGSAETQRNLKCNTCSFSTPYVFLLRAHLRNTHRSNRPVKDVLAFCFRQGAIKEGYHCEWCVFSHKNANRVYKHYQELHPQHTSSLEYIHARLYVGPNKELLQKDTPKVESAHPRDGADDRPASKSSKQIESETYPCTRCSFKSKSKSGLSRHTNEIHPKLAKDSLDFLSRKEASARSQLEELSERPGVFESFQVPLEETDEPITSSTASDTKHSPITHSPANRGKSFDAKKGGKNPADTQSQIHVFKCRHCNYFNTLSQGILTHCYMKHPSLTCKTDSLHLSPARIHKCRRTNEAGENVKFSGYMCKTCPQIFESKYGLNKHCEREHNKTVKPVSKVKSGITPAKPYSTHESVSTASFFSKHKYTKVKCQHCSVFCNTKTALHRHMQKEHLNTFSKDCLFKCMLCHKIYFVKNKLRNHYLKFHGKPALLKHYVPVHELPSSKPEPRDRLQEQLQSTEGKLSVYKCPRCSYIHVSHHGILTHCQMKHPAYVARGHKLETGEIFISDIVKCSDGKGKYQRGYQCKTCPQIHPSVARLKAHKCEHGKVAAADDSLENPPASESEPGPMKNQTAEPVPSLSTTKTLLNNECSYQCQVCTYKTSTRPKLRDHYKYTHKFNAASVYKLLEKYNKRKRNYLLAYAEYKKSRDIKCKVCPDRFFESCQLLIDHYSTFHKLNSKLDFTVLSLGLKYNTTGLYRCAECLIQLNGTKKLCYHLDRHKEMVKTKRRKAAPAVGSSLHPKPSEVRRRDKGPTFELSKWSSAPAEAIVPLPSPRSPEKITMEESEADNQHPCRRCHRAFKSLRALQTHERGHAALAAIRKRDRVSKLNQDIKEFILYKSGTSKPFRCSCCIYRTNIINLMRSHILKTHQDIIQRTKEKGESSNEDEEQPQKEEMEPSESSEKRNSPEPDEDPEETEESEYSEHADVQRQLNHYSLVAQKNDKANGNVLKSFFLENCTLYCEICTFNTEHLSSIRRHYMNRHGKKLLKCKDCEFVTGLRKTLELHSQMGHSSYESKPTHQQIIRCPFCLYHSKNKNNMIDHIVLHREERVLPVELNRPKLSRYLRGTVFRCHKCTFSSGGAETLRLHMMKHGGDVQPYRCRLCYFDCSQMAELEAHLSDKHQVLRNHQLVSRVDECNRNDNQAENKEFVSDRDQFPQNDIITEYGARDAMFLPIEETHVKQEREENESSVSDFQPGDAQPQTAVQKSLQQDSPSADLSVASALSARRERTNMHEGLGDPEEEESLTRLLGQLKEEAEEAQVDGLGLQELQQISKAASEDDAERRVLPLGEDASRSHGWEDRKPTIKIEKVETVCGDRALRDEEGSTSCSPNPTTNSVSANVSSAQTAAGGPTSERRSLTHSTRYTQQTLNWKSLLGAGLESCEPEQQQTLSDWKDTTEPRGDVPAPETEQQELLQSNEEEETELLQSNEEEETELLQSNEEEETELLQSNEEEETELLAQKQDVKDETRCKEQEVPSMCDADEAAEVPRDDKPFTCHFCGRNLTNASELKRHVKRHGL